MAEDMFRRTLELAYRSVITCGFVEPVKLVTRPEHSSSSADMK